MKTKSIRSITPSFLLPALGLLAAGGAFGACTAKFETECPEGTEQTAGGGDVSDACTPIGGGGSGAAGGNAGAPGGSSGSAGVGGSAGAPVPPGGACGPGATKCEGDAQQTCGADGQWGVSAACDIACDGAASKCVVPVQLAAGAKHMCARLSDGTARCWGSDAFGQLGNGAGANSSRPAPVLGLTDATSLNIGGENLSCAVLAGGTASCWGESFFQGAPATIRQEPVPIPGARDVKFLGVSNTFLCIGKNSGAFECMGANDSGQLGNGGNQPSLNFAPTSGFPSTPLQVTMGIGDTACAALSGGKVACWGGGNNSGQNGNTAGNDLLTPTLLPNVTDAREVALGGVDFGCAVTNGGAQCWGRNHVGHLGRGFASGGIEGPAPVANLTGVSKVALGLYHACAAKDDGSLWCWGGNEHGQLGNTCAALGCETPAPPTSPYIASAAKVPLSGRAVDVVAGWEFTCALTDDAKTYCWGTNDVGQLGDGTFGVVTVPAPKLVIWK